MLSFDLIVKSRFAVLFEVEPLDVDPLDVEPLDVDPLDVDPLEEEPLESALTAFVNSLSVVVLATPVCSSPLAFWKALRAAIDFSPNIPSIDPV